METPVRLRIATVSLAAIAVTGIAHAQWTVTNLHPGGSDASSGHGVGDGQEVGYAYVGPVTHASLWTGTAESWIDLNPVGAVHSESYGAQGGFQVGLAQVGDVERASLWAGSAGSWVDLNPAGIDSSRALGVGDGQQVGYTHRDSESSTRAALWSGSSSSWVNLDPAGALNSIARGVRGGVQVGDASLEGSRHAGMWLGTAASWVDLHPSPGAMFSYACAVDAGQQVGYTLDESLLYHAALWTGSGASWVDLSPVGAVHSFAYGVDGGLQVGYAFIGSDHAGVWSGTASSWLDLHSFLSSDFVASRARGIWRDASYIYIVGEGDNAITGRTEALLWRQPVPEPTSLFALGLGLYGLRMIRRRRTGSMQKGGA